ncbi:hypothetical protein [Yinghuangia sp. YIM S09857]|uniref:hypothetical protein n=1 Tax=Yinghuangia sp. YIM S09857 TaxID=3436929 RepID=UPI003F52EF76
MHEPPEGTAEERVFFRVDAPHRAVAAAVHAPLRAWLHDTVPGFDPDAFDVGITDVGGGVDLLAESGRGEDGAVTTRRRLRFGMAGHAALVVRSPDAGNSWVLLTCTASPHPTGTALGSRALADAVPGLVRGLLEAVDARDGTVARLTALPRAVMSTADASELEDAVTDPHRRLPLLVAADAPSARRAAWEAAMVRLAARTAGHAGLHLLMPPAAGRFGRRAGFNAPRACGDDAVLVYLPRGDGEFGGSALLPDGELRLAAASDVETPGVTGLFTIADIRRHSALAELPAELSAVPTLLDTGPGGDANFDDPAILRDLVREADQRARRAEAHARSLATTVAGLTEQLRRARRHQDAHA